MSKIDYLAKERSHEEAEGGLTKETLICLCMFGQKQESEAQDDRPNSAKGTTSELKQYLSSQGLDEVALLSAQLRFTETLQLIRLHQIIYWTVKLVCLN